MIEPTKAKTVTALLASIDEPRRAEVKALHALIRKAVPKLEPYLLGNMVGYGRYAYRYATGRTGEWCVIGLASQKNYISVYVCASEGGQYVAEKNRALLPKASIGKSCIRFKRLSDVDEQALARVIQEGATVMARSGQMTAASTKKSTTAGGSMKKARAARSAKATSKTAAKSRTKRVKRT